MLSQLDISGSITVDDPVHGPLIEFGLISPLEIWV